MANFNFFRSFISSQPSLVDVASSDPFNPRPSGGGLSPQQHQDAFLSSDPWAGSSSSATATAGAFGTPLKSNTSATTSNNVGFGDPFCKLIVF